MLQEFSSSGLFIGTTFLAVIYDEERFSQFIKSERNWIHEKASQYKFLRPLAGDTIFFTNGIRYKESKKAMVEAVNPANLKTYIKSFSKNAENLVNTLAENIGQGEIDIEPEFNVCIISNLLETIMRLVPTVKNKNEIVRFGQEFSKSLQYVTERGHSIWCQYDIIYKMSNLSKKMEKSSQYVRKFCETLVRERRNKFAEGQMDDCDALGTAFIDKFFESKKSDGSNFSEKEVVDDVLGIMGAGFDTTATSIGFILMLLAMNQDIQQKVVNEIEEKLPENKTNWTCDDLNQLVYMEQVFHETWRLYPPVPTVGRRATSDIYLDNGGVITKGTDIWFFIFKMHRDPKIYPNPDQFNPDNFLPERVKSRTPINFMPFGFGARKCFGNVFAKLIIKSTLCHLLKSYVFQTTKTEKDFHLRFEVALKNKFGFPLSIVPRN